MNIIRQKNNKIKNISHILILFHLFILQYINTIKIKNKSKILVYITIIQRGIIYGN